MAWMKTTPWRRHDFLYDSALQKQKWKAERVLSPRAAPLGKFGNVQYAPPDATAAGPRLSGMRKFLCSVRAALTALTCRLSMSPARRVALRDQGSAALSTATWRTCWDA